MNPVSLFLSQTSDVCSRETERVTENEKEKGCHAYAHVLYFFVLVYFICVTIVVSQLFIV